MVSVTDWSTVPGSNGTVDGINIAEGCPAANMNGALRSIMAGVRSFYDTVPNTANYILRDGSVTFTGNPRFNGRGGYLHFNDTGLTSGRVFVQPAGGSPPAMSNGDILIEY